MGRRNKNIGQSSMFDLTGKPLIDYRTTEKDINEMLKSIPTKKIVEPTANKLVEVFQEPEISEKIDGNNEIISVSVPFVFYDTGVVDAIFTRKKYSVQSCIEFYFHVLDGDLGYKRFSKRLEDIEKFFSRFFGWDGDKEYLRESMAFKKIEQIKVL